MKSEKFEVEPIAHIYTDFSDKFGIPRQSGRVPGLIGKIVFCPKYRVKEALRGIEEYSHIWLVFVFSKSRSETFSPTVRPPRLGGNTRVGVFATRSPNRPNHLGLSCVKLIKVEHSDEDKDYLLVSGADLLSGTPIIDIKPYLPSDSYPDALGGFSDKSRGWHLSVTLSKDFGNIPDDVLDNIKSCIAEDPRPSYQNDGERVYNMLFDKYEISFFVKDNIATIIDIVKK